MNNSIHTPHVYNCLIGTQVITALEVYPTVGHNYLTYSKPHDVCNGIQLHLGNMAGGFPLQALGHTWASSEHLYLCGEWSVAGDRSVEIQQDILSAKSGYAAKRFKKNKYRKEIREDFPVFRDQWMLWVVWQKCIGNPEFRAHLLSLPNHDAIVEVVKNDTVWAADYNDEGNLIGANGMGKILTICRTCLQQGVEPFIDRALLNNSNIYILGNKVQF